LTPRLLDTCEDAVSAQEPMDDIVSGVAASIAVWRRLQLELGDAAVVTGGHSLSHLIALTARWMGAVPVVMLRAPNLPVIPDIRVIDNDDSASALKELQAVLENRPGVAVAELSGRADCVDIVLEGIPAGTRLLFAGEARECLTIDFYVNVHRKGLLLHSAVLDQAFGDEFREPAARLLADPVRREQSLAALAAGELSVGAR
jgi:hypothetical protein